MKHISKSIICMSLTCLALCACNSDEPSDNAPSREVAFTSLMGDIAPSHSWNSACRQIINIVADHAGARVEIFSDWNGRRFRIAEFTTSEPSEVVRFDAAPDMEVFTVLVDGAAYTARSGQEIRATGTATRPAWADEAEPLGWILAADLDGDFDYNDVVARFVPESDGGVTVTALAGGITGAYWLHFTNGGDDYILSPLLHDGVMDTKAVDSWTAPDFVWHSFFGDDQNPNLYSGWKVNTMAVSGANNYTGRSVTVPGSLFGSNYFTPTYLCLSEGRDENLRVVSGFYITQGMFDIKRPIDDEDVEQRIYSTLTPGTAPYFLVIPDICADELDERVAHWQWPTEESRIDLVYPAFKAWVTDPSVAWSMMRPEGWANRPATINELGQYTYFGFYRRY